MIAAIFNLRIANCTQRGHGTQRGHLELAEEQACKITGATWADIKAEPKVWGQVST